MKICYIIMYNLIFYIYYRNMKIKNIENDVVFEDLLLSELLRWFKFDFFKWVDSPTCSNCMGECSFDRQIAASDSKISRIEIHK